MSRACRDNAAPTSAASTVVIVPTVLALQVTGASVAFISGYRRGAPEPPRQIRMMVAVGTISSRSSLDHSGCLRDWRRPRHVWPRGQPQSTPHRALADEPRRSAERSMRGGRYLPSPCQPSEQNIRNKCNGCFGCWLLLAATGAARAFNTSGHIPIPRVAASGDPWYSPP